MGFQKFGSRGGGGRGSFRGSRGGKFDNFNSGPPEEVIEVGNFSHPCQEDVVCKLITEKIPYSNAPVYLQNKEEVGKVDEIFGPIKDAYFSIKLLDTLKSKSFKEGSKFYMDPARFMPLERVLNPNTTRGRGGNRGRGQRGDFRGGRGSTPGRGDFRGGRGGDFRGGRGGDFRGGRGGDFRGGRGGDFRGGRGGDFRGGRGGDFRGGRSGDFRGGRGRWSDRADFRGGRGGFRGGRDNMENGRHSFGGKRDFASSETPQSKKFKSDE